MGANEEELGQRPPHHYLIITFLTLHMWVERENSVGPVTYCFSTHSPHSTPLLSTRVPEARPEE
jgi:hypothetical protein